MNIKAQEWQAVSVLAAFSNEFFFPVTLDMRDSPHTEGQFLLLSSSISLSQSLRFPRKYFNIFCHGHKFARKWTETTDSFHVGTEKLAHIGC